MQWDWTLEDDGLGSTMQDWHVAEDALIEALEVWLTWLDEQWIERWPYVERRKANIR